MESDVSAHPHDEFDIDRLAENAVVELPIRKPTFDWRSLDDVASEPKPEEWVAGLLGPGVFLFAYGAPKSGKTFAVLDLLARCAGGSTFAGTFEVARPLRCGYATAEGRHMIGPRLKAAAKRAGLDKHARDRLHVLRRLPNLMDDKSVGEFIQDAEAYAREHGSFDVLVLDTLALSMVGGNENDTLDAGRACDNMQRIQKALANPETGAEPAVILVHHSGKTSGDMRGSVVFGAVADGKIKFTREKDGRRFMASDGMKDVPEFGPIEFQLAADFFDDTDTPSVEWLDAPAKAPTERNTRDRLIDAMRRYAAGRENAKTVADLLPLIEGAANRTTVLNLLAAMRDKAERGVFGVLDGKAWRYWLDSE